MSLISDVTARATAEATAIEEAKWHAAAQPPYSPGTSGTPTTAQPADPLATLASLYMAALNPGGAAQQPQYVVTPTAADSGGGGAGVSWGGLTKVALVGVIGFLGWRWWKHRHGGK